MPTTTSANFSIPSGTVVCCACLSTRDIIRPAIATRSTLNGAEIDFCREHAEAWDRCVIMHKRRLQTQGVA